MEDTINNIKLKIKNNNNNDAITLLYDNINDIGSIFETYIDTLNDKTGFKEIDLIMPINKIDQLNNHPCLCSLIRAVILYLVVTIANDEHAIIQYNEKEILKYPSYKIHYKTVIADSIVKQKLFSLFMIVYYLESMIRAKTYKGDMLKHNKSMLAIDFEFRERKMALSQLNFETTPSNKVQTYSYIWLVNPMQFDDFKMNIFVEYVLRNGFIKKILHGADSQDIERLFVDIFKNNRDAIMDFMKKFTDTKILCEYYKLSIGDEMKKCKINNAYLYFDTITKIQFEKLENTHEFMGPVQDIAWDIHNLGSHSTKYAIYDVLFLKHFHNDIYIKAKKTTHDIYYSYTFIPSIIRLVYLDKREIITLSADIKTIIDPTNNYYIKTTNDNIITLNSIYKKVKDDMVLHEVAMNIDTLLKINYFKGTLSLIFKNIIYSIVTHNFAVFKNKKEMLNTKISAQNIFDVVEKLGFKKIIKLLNIFSDVSSKKINTLYK